MKADTALRDAGIVTIDPYTGTIDALGATKHACNETRRAHTSRMDAHGAARRGNGVAVNTGTVTLSAHDETGGAGTASRSARNAAGNIWNWWPG